MWWNHYVGLPFRWNGAEREGVSCWGLVVLVQREVFGRALPRPDEWGVKDGDTEAADPWTAFLKPVPLPAVATGDILHMRGGRPGVALHCGVVTVPGEVLHIEAGALSHVRRYIGDRTFRNRVVGAYRVV